MSVLLGLGIVSLSLGISCALAGWAGFAVYRALRRSLYQRPLTAEEQWSETSEEAKMEESWMNVTTSSWMSK